MAKAVRRAESVKFLRQAEEFLASAKQNHEEGRMNAAVFTAVQSMINANDALTIHYLEKRASTDHREGLKLHADVVKQINDGSQRKKLKNAFELRSHSGYLGEPMSKADADKTVRAPQR